MNAAARYRYEATIRKNHVLLEFLSASHLVVESFTHALGFRACTSRKMSINDMFHDINQTKHKKVKKWRDKNISRPQS